MTTYERKPRKLRKLIIDRIDLCDKGANPDARIMLFKRHAREEISEEKFSELRRRIDRLFRNENTEGKPMSIAEIAKRIDEGKIVNKEQAWAALNVLVSEAVAEELINASEAQRVARTREQLLVDLITNSEEGKRLYSLYRELPDGPPLVEKREEVKQPEAWGKIEKMAQSLVTEGKAKTIQQAVARVIEESPALYLEYVSERLG